MYAVFVEANADEAHLDAAREFLPNSAVPMAERPVRKPVTGSPRKTAGGSPLSSTTPKTKPGPGERGSGGGSRRPTPAGRGGWRGRPVGDPRCPPLFEPPPGV